MKMQLTGVLAVSNFTRRLQCRVGVLADSSNLQYWINYFPIFYSETLSQITIGDFRKTARPIFLKSACGLGVGVVTSNYRELGVKIWCGFILKSRNNVIFHITPRHLEGYLTLTPYTPGAISILFSVMTRCWIGHLNTHSAGKCEYKER